MPSKPSTVVALIASLLCVWVVVFWLYRPADVDLSATPITAGRMPALDEIRNPPLVAVEQATPAVEQKPMPPQTVLDDQGRPEPARVVTKPTRVVIPPEFLAYTVQKGDVSFQAIAKRIYGDIKHSDAISRSNPFVTPNKLIVGKTQLRIPKDPTNVQGKEVLVTPPTGADQLPIRDAGKPESPATAARTHVTQPGETLSSIAKKYYGKSAAWKKIADANRDTLPDPARLKAGLELVIPAE